MPNFNLQVPVEIPIDYILAEGEQPREPVIGKDWFITNSGVKLADKTEPANVPYIGKKRVIVESAMEIAMDFLPLLPIGMFSCGACIVVSAFDANLGKFYYTRSHNGSVHSETNQLIFKSESSTQNRDTSNTIDWVVFSKGNELTSVLCNRIISRKLSRIANSVFFSCDGEKWSAHYFEMKKENAE